MENLRSKYLSLMGFWSYLIGALRLTRLQGGGGRNEGPRQGPFFVGVPYWFGFLKIRTYVS